MRDVKELYRMVAQQVEPDVDVWTRQERRQRRAVTGRRTETFAVVATLIALLSMSLIVTLTDALDRRNDTGTDLSSGRAVHTFVDLDGGVSTPMPGKMDEGTFYSASPTGARLAWSPWPNPIGDADRLAVYVSNADGSDVQRVTPVGIDAIGPRWSPEGRWIVYQGRNRSSKHVGNLFVVDATSGDVTQITDLPAAFSHWWFMSPSFSPDGKTIVFHMPRRSRSDRWDLWSVPATGGDPTLLRRDAAYGSFLADGSIAFLEQPRFGSSAPPAGLISDVGIWIIDADGSDPRPLLEREGVHLPIASPDGTKIAYQTGYEVRVISAAAEGDTSTIIDNTSPFWLDDDTLIVAASLPIAPA